MENFRGMAINAEDSLKLTVLIGDNLPKLGTDLVTALTGLNVNNLSHF